MAGSDAQAGRGETGDARWPARLSASDYAWEFLRRNPDYRRAFQDCGAGGRLDPRWGLEFPADPGLGPHEVRVYWRADAAPALVLPVAPAPVGEARSWRPVPRAAETRRADDGWRAWLGNGLQLHSPSEAGLAGPLMVVLAFDRDFGLRLKAARALGEREARVGCRLAAHQRLRLERSLRALDGALNQDSYRAIAEAVFGQAVVDREPWRGGTLRDVTIRLVRSGKALMRGGYLRLLRRGL